MKIAELFETKIEDKIEPVIKVGEIQDSQKVASEIGSYVLTPLIERHIDDFLEHFTDTFLTKSSEIGMWISGYFGAGKSHFAKILSLIVGNPDLNGIAATKRFESRIPPDSPHKDSILRSLARVGQCNTTVLGFNLNTLSDSRNRPLASLLLSQYYISLGYSTNLIYARVIESELDKQGRISELHSAVETKTGKSWTEVQRNLTFYRTQLYAAACEVAPEVFGCAEDVDKALKHAEQGELHNVAFLVDTIMNDLAKRERDTKRPQRLLLVLDEAGQWIENDAGRLAQLQALIEESAIKGQGKIWIVVTTHGDMGSIYKEARALDADMKKIEGRFRFKPALTTENIELVLEQRLLRKTLAGEQKLQDAYTQRAGVLRGMAELANTEQLLPACGPDKFSVYYPFFPYQIHLVPEIVKSLRSKGGRGEQMAGSTRTLLAITQDILRIGKRRYLELPLGSTVSFDEVYHNLAGEGEISPDVRTEISRIKEVVPGATSLTPRVAEVLFLVRELSYIPRTRENIARLLMESIDDDLPTVLANIEPELERLIKAKLVGRVGDEYEFLTGERRTFEEEVATIENQYKQHDRERGLKEQFVHGDGKSHWRHWLRFDSVRYRDNEFSIKLEIDENSVPSTTGYISLKLFSPLSATTKALDVVENQSLLPNEQNTIFFLSGRVKGFEQDLERYLATKEVIDAWKGSSNKSEDARKLAQDRESNDLPKLHRKVIESLKEGLRTGHVVFRGSSRAMVVPSGQLPSDTLKTEMAAFWPLLYAYFDKVPNRITNDQKSIQEVLAGTANQSADIKALKIYDKSGKIDLHAPLLDAVRLHLTKEHSAGRRILGRSLIERFEAPPYGWDPNAVRVGIAALVRASAVKVMINKKPYTNPADRELVDAIRVSRSFDKVDLVPEETEVTPDILTSVRSFLIGITKRRSIEETPSSLSDAANELATSAIQKAETVKLWATGSGLLLPTEFTAGEEAWRDIHGMSVPANRVRELFERQEALKAGYELIDLYSSFREANGKQFVALVAFINQIEAVEHLLPLQSNLLGLLQDFRTTSTSTSLIDKEIWKRLLSKKAAATLELDELLEKWRSDARTRLADAIARVPSEIGTNADSAEEADLAQPLHTLSTDVDSVLLPAQVAALGDRVTRAIKEVGARISAARTSKTDGKSSGSGSSSMVSVAVKRETKKVRLADVAAFTVVTNEQEWLTLKDKLDAHVCTLLREYDVELE